MPARGPPPRARFSVAFSPARVPLSPMGGERAEFLLAPNPGEEARPLARIASGGELSRVMLALHVVLEDTGLPRTVVFDEVDVGIDGATADAVGARLARLASRRQVLCVTHLPQVAVYADRHYHVRKRVEGGRTRADVLPLAGRDRIDELARMLGGKTVTEISRPACAPARRCGPGPPGAGRRPACARLPPACARDSGDRRTPPPAGGA